MFLRVCNAFMAVLFAFAAVVQYNDPDALYWVAMYLAGAVVCALAVANRLVWFAPALVGAAALIWAGTLAPEVWGRVRLGRLFEAWEMANTSIEQGREMGGLLILAGWMIFLVVASRRHQQS